MTQTHRAAAAVARDADQPPPPRTGSSSSDALQLVAAAARLTEREEAEIAAVQAQKRAPNTKRTYDSLMRNFRAFCASRDATALPADPQTIALYLNKRAAAGIRIGSLTLALAAIRAAHIDAKPPLEDPTRALSVRDTLAGLRRNYGAPPRQAAPLTAADFVAIEEVARRPRQLGKRRDKAGQPIFETEAAAARRGAIDLALIATLRCALLRRSEAAALQWGDLTTEADGSGRLLIRRSKTDQTGEGKLLYLPAAAVALLNEIRPSPVAPQEPIFGLSASQIGRRVKAAAAAAGLQAEIATRGYTAHSGRVGMATDLMASGATGDAIQLAGRWQSSRMPVHYARSIAAGDGAVAQYTAQTGAL